MNSIFFYLLYTYIAIDSSRTAPAKKNAYFQIDEFIKQLMTSEKFDELADVIADKAARKIKNMENEDPSYNPDALRQSTKGSKNDSDEEKSRHQHKHEKIDKKDSKSTEEHSNHDRKNNKNKETRSDENPSYDRKHTKKKDSRSNEKPNSYMNKHKEKDSGTKSNEKTNRDSEKTSSIDKRDKYEKPKFSSIDTQAFLDNPVQSKELELNFKHLKGELEKHRFNVKGNSLKSNKEYNKHSGAHNENNRAVDKHEFDKSDNSQGDNNNSQKEKNDDSKEFKLSDANSNENAAHEQATFHDIGNNQMDEANSKDSKSANKSDSVAEKAIISKYKFTEQQQSNEKPIPRIEKSTKDFADGTKSVEENEEIKEVPHRKGPTYPSKELENPQEEDERRNLPRVTKRKVREENGKLYVLQTSLEYAEYHENVAKQYTKHVYINPYK